MVTKQFKQGEVIFAEGSSGEEMYEIRSGSVAVFAAHGTPDEKKLTELEAGRIFGEMAVIDDAPRSATAVAASDVEVVEITRDDLETYFEERPEKLLTVMRGMSRRLRELTKDYEEVCDTIGEWKEATEQGTEKSSGLMAAIRKFASIFAESSKYMSMPNAGLYYHYQQFFYGI